MALNVDRFKKDLNKLRHRGSLLELAMLRDLSGIEKVRFAVDPVTDEEFEEMKSKIPDFKIGYEAWYSECISVIRQVLPDRLSDFERQYERPKGRKSADYESYVIEDYMLKLRVTRYSEETVGPSAAFSKLQNQTAILAAAESRFNSSLFEIRQILQADLFDTEISSARELSKNGFYRAAGAVSGVVLEKHLAQVCEDHGVKIAKKNPGIGDLNELLKAAGVIDIPQWRHISMLGDIRNICDHNKKLEPTASQVSDLIDGVDKILKTIS